MTTTINKNMKRSMMRQKAGFMLIVFITLAILPWMASGYVIDLFGKTMILAIFALSLELLVGTTGLVCFGQAAFFGIGAYSVVLLSAREGEPLTFFILMALSMLCAGVFALAVGAMSLRTKGVYFIMVTLAFAQMAYYIVHDTPLGGGTDGIYLSAKPSLGFIGNIDNPLVFYAVIWFCLLATFLFLAVLKRARFGHALAGIRVNEQRMRATGFSTYPYKLAAFVISGMLAGMAGFLFAIKDGAVNPELLSWHFSGAVLIMIIMGGIGHLRGAVIGAFAFALLQELYQSEAIFGILAKHWHLALGLTIILSVALLPNGLVGLPTLIKQRLAGNAKLVRTEGAQDE